jgi:serine/threonine-protein kinase
MDALAQLNSALVTRYVVDREIGRGGMATVYLARDLRHERRVALKVLNPELGAVLGVERFLTEIKVTANLQHPNLLPLFDSGEAEGLLFYVMPYVEGESLRARLEREKQLPVDDAIRIATAIAGALDYAHRHGVIHRDLKPENILLHEGQPLVADFGIALAVSNAGGSRITQTGLSLGTPQYMSPEQATGDRVIDGRTDIYSLAAMLYEMLVGDPPHLGSTAQAIIAKVLMDRPPGVRTMRPAVDEHVDAAIERGLEKLPADRWATAGAFGEAIGGRLTASTTTRATRRAASVRARHRDPVVVGLASALVASLVVAGVAIVRARAPRVAGRVSFSITSTDTRRLGDGFPAISADGSRLAFVAESAGVMRLYVRTLDQFEARALPGTEKLYVASPPCFSLDNQWLAFVADSKLKRARFDGSQPPEVLAEASNVPVGCSWSADGSIVFAPDIAKGLVRIPSGGGTAEVLTAPDRNAGQIGYAWPDVLPDGSAVLFGLVTRDGWSVRVRSLRGPQEKTLIEGATMARYLSSGHLIYVKAGRVYAVRFDPKHLAIDAREPPVLLNVSAAGGIRAGGPWRYIAAAASGTIAYVEGQSASTQSAAASAIMRVDRQGNTTPLREGSGEWPRLSPRGDAILAEDSAQIWLYDLTRGGARTRLTSGPPRYVPVWSPDGLRFVYASYQDGPANLYLSTLADPGHARRIVAGDNRRYPASWSRDGKYLAYMEAGNVSTGLDILVVPMAGDSVGVPIPAVRTEADEYHPSFSPDGKWLSYTSARSGRPEVYVQGFPDPGAPRRVSTDGGAAPMWNPNGRELFYVNGKALMSMSVTPGPVLQYGVPQKLFELSFALSAYGWYDVSPDGTWFVAQTEPPAPARRLDVIVNWRP